jgi:hypothetical protein
VSAWALGLSFLSVLVIPLLVLIVRIAVKLTQSQDKLTVIASDLEKLVADKDKVHAEMLAAMRDDRNATNRRLRWLEENVWVGKRGG